MKHYLTLHLLSARRALTGLLRQPLGSLLSLLLLSLALALPIGLYLTLNSLSGWLGKLTTTPELSVYMELGSGPDALQRTQNALAGTPGVAQVKLVPRDQALVELEARNGLHGLADGLESNPLPDVFILTPSAHQPEALAQLQQRVGRLPQVSAVEFDAGWARRLAAFNQLGEQLVLLLGGVCALALLLLTHNTIRLQILARRDEIEVATLIGASPSFIARPFLYLAFWQGLLATLLAWALSSAFVGRAAPVLEEFAKLYNEHVALRGLLVQELLLVIALTCALAMSGAWLATRKHLAELAPR